MPQSPPTPTHTLHISLSQPFRYCTSRERSTSGAGWHVAARLPAAVAAAAPSACLRCSAARRAVRRWWPTKNSAVRRIYRMGALDNHGSSLRCFIGTISPASLPSDMSSRSPAAPRGVARACSAAVFSVSAAHLMGEYARRLTVPGSGGGGGGGPARGTLSSSAEHAAVHFLAGFDGFDGRERGRGESATK